MINQQVEIINKLGLHARASALLVTTANKFASEVQLELAGQQADAKSIMAVMMLAASKGSIVEITIDGSDEEAAMTEIVALIEDYFHEGE